MNNSIMTIMLSALLALTGCATMKGGEAAVEIKSSRHVQLTSVSVSYDDGVAKVFGILRPTSSAVRRVGHVDVAFLDGDEAEIISVKAVPHITTFSRNSARKPSFTAFAEVDESKVAVVRLTHHPDLSKACEL